MNIEMNKKTKSLVAVYGVLAVVYILLFTLIPFHKNAASWLTFAFTVISFAGGLFITHYAFSGSGSLVSKVYGYPIFRVGALYVGLQFVIGALICIVAAFVNVPYWVALIVSILLIGAVAIGLIATDNIKDIVEAEDAKIENITKAVSTFNVDMAGIMDICDNAEVKKELQKLAEDFRFSDPVSSGETKIIEDELFAEIDKLKAVVSDNNTENAIAQIKKVSNKLSERNRICKANKR